MAAILVNIQKCHSRYADVVYLGHHNNQPIYGVT
jgi:hypothetical protein